MATTSAQFISVPIIGAALVFMVLIGCINFYGISESVRINVILTCVEITGLVLIVVIGAALAGGHGDPGGLRVQRGTSVLTALLAGTVLAFYALIGFDDSVNVAEETQHPSRNYPRAIFGALLLAGVSTSSSPSPPRWWCRPRRSPSRAARCSGGQGGSDSHTDSALRGHRAPRGLQRRPDQHDHGLPHHLRHGGPGVMPTVSPGCTLAAARRGSPSSSPPLIALLVLIAIGRNDEALALLGSTTVVLLLIAFVMVNISVLVLRRDEVGHEHFRTPTVFPILGAVVAAGLLIYQAVSDICLRTGGLLLLLGAILYGVNLLVMRSLEREAG